jgi:predicted acyl esterase
VKSRLLLLTLAFPSFIALASCKSSEDAAEEEPFKVRESVEQLHVTHAPPKTELAVVDASGKQVQTGITDELGSLMFRKVPPGAGYVVRTTSGNLHSRALTVMSVETSARDQSFYASQTLVAGSGYIKTRDGTTLSIYVTMPGPIDKGPYPTVVDYSGYDPSKPGGPLAGDFGRLCKDLPTLCDAPNDPGGLIAGLVGYATVSVNMRGTGCSGGAYDYFETLQLLDGYDIIETVAAQPWALHHKVGMVGLSYPGISQLFVASVKPPSLAAIAPLSVIGNSSTTVLPGGILNDGFATTWITQVLDKAAPYGQGWEKAKVDAGDQECAENQLLHGQRLDNVAEARKAQWYDPAKHDQLNPTHFVDQINVPVFLACAFQDEQTGPLFTTLLDRFKSSPLTRFTIYNGVHPDAFAPQVLIEWQEFLDLHVAKRIPKVPKTLRNVVPQLFDKIFHANMVLPDDRFASYATYEEALAAYDAELPLRVIFENGGGMDKGAPEGTFEMKFKKWPADEVKPQRFYFEPDGTLGDAAPSDASAASSFQLDPDAGGRGILAPGGNVWDKLPAYDWRPLVTDHAVAFVSAPLEKDLVMMGTGSVDVFLRSTVDDADLEVNLSEVRPDDQEMYVQSGWLRASYRKLGDDSTVLWPMPTFLEKDWALLVPGEWTQARIPIAGFAHVFRKGSRIRISIDTPGDSRAEWRFLLKTFDKPAVHTIGHNATQPSSVVLPVLDGVAATTPLPACPSLRGQPCRAYVPYTNVAAK